MSGRWLENDVIQVAVRHFESLGYRALAAEGNQAGLFAYSIGSRRTKYPDVVLYRDAVVAVFEAKARVSSLFSAPDGGMSDYESVCYLANSCEAQQQVIRRALSILKTVGVKPAEPLHLTTGLIAAGDFGPWLTKLDGTGIMLVSVDMTSRGVMASVR